MRLFSFFKNRAEAKPERVILQAQGTDPQRGWPANRVVLITNGNAAGIDHKLMCEFHLAFPGLAVDSSTDLEGVTRFTIDGLQEFAPWHITPQVRDVMLKLYESGIINRRSFDWVPEFAHVIDDTSREAGSANAAPLSGPPARDGQFDHLDFYYQPDREYR